MAVQLSTFLAALQQMADARPTYRTGGSGKDGTCDCIGLIIGALRIAGYRWPGDHSSNWAPRRAMVSLRNISSASDLNPGDAIYKYREPGEDRYKLPARFQNGADKRDYYHVGFVISTSPLQIMHCTKDDYHGIDGITIDTKIGRWRAAGGLKYITSDGGGILPQKEVLIVLYEAVVNTGNETLNIRSEPRAGTRVLYKERGGTVVRVLEVIDDTWVKIDGSQGEGYAMSRFLTTAGVPGTTQAGAPAVVIRCGSIEEANAIASILRSAEASTI